MLQHDGSGTDTQVERRKHWRDRRVRPDRRNPERLQRSAYDCRSGSPRRESDVGGELAEGAVWWQEGKDYL